MNHLPIYPQSDGLFEWSNCSGNYAFKAFDVHGNLTKIEFTIKNSGNSSHVNPLSTTANYYFPDSVNTLLYPEFQVLMEPGTFYEPLEKIFRIDSSSTYMSLGFEFSEYEIPVQKNFDVRLKVPELPENFPVNKIGVGLISNKGYLSFKKGDFVNGWIEAQSRNFGKFVLMADTTGPKITPLDFNEGKTITKYRTMELKIEDNLSGVWIYKAFINEAWALMYYNRKKKKYVIPLNARSKPNLRKGENKIRIYTRDVNGNETENVWTVVY